MKLLKLNNRGFSHFFIPLLIVIAIGAIGTYVMVMSHAATMQTNCAKNPHVCGYPDGTNSGPPTGTKLSSTLKTGTNTGHGWTYDSKNQDILISANGAVLQNVTAKNTEIVVKANNVTIKNVNITGINDPGGFGIWLVGAKNNGTSNVTIENTTIAGLPPSTSKKCNGKTESVSNDCQRLLAGIKDIYGDSKGTKLLNNNISFISTGIQIDEGLVQGNYIHDMAMRSGDHVNGTTSNGASGASLTLNHNTVFNRFSQTDAISLFEDFGRQYNRVISNNLVAGGGYCIYGGQNPGGKAISNIKITGNRFSTLYYPKCGGQGGGTITAFTTKGTGNSFSGNIWDNTGKALPF